jgi:hypothetical protein
MEIVVGEESRILARHWTNTLSYFDFPRLSFRIDPKRAPTLPDSRGMIVWLDPRLLIRVHRLRRDYTIVPDHSFKGDLGRTEDSTVTIVVKGGLRKFRSEDPDGAAGLDEPRTTGDSKDLTHPVVVVGQARGSPEAT